MKKLNYGLKLWTINADLIESAVQLVEDKIFDYIELFVVPGTKIEPFLFDIPYIIHIPHEKFGVNIGNPLKNDFNLRIINTCIHIADQLDAQYLVLHPGEDSFECTKSFIQGLSDDRILIENLPKVGILNEDLVGYSPMQINELLSGTELGFCLDLAHAIKASYSMNMDYKKVLQQFLELDPKMFHIADGHQLSEKDEHLNINEGDFDLKYLKQCIIDSSSGIVTMETPRIDHKCLDEDLKNINILRSI